MNKIKKYMPFVLPFTIYAFPAIFLYAKNVKEANLSDMLLPMLALVSLGYVIFAIAYIVYRSALPASIYSALLGFVILNYGFFERAARKLLPFLRIWQLLPLAALGIGIIIAVLNYKATAWQEPIALLLTICFQALILVNIITALPTEIVKLTATEKTNEFDNLTFVSEPTRPNIYYILLDEYAGFIQCKNGLGYDNTQLESFLKNEHFNISYASHNDSSSTTVVMTNIFALDYIADDSTTSAQMSKSIKSGILHDILKKSGYTQRGVGDTQWLYISNDLKSKKQSKAMTDDGEDFWSLLTKNMIFSDQNNFTEHSGVNASILLRDMDSFDTFALSPNSSQFNMLYLCCPHHPFYFNSDGSRNTDGNLFNYDGDNVQGYIAQLQYVTTRIAKSIKRIIDNDPNSIILLCSDHGLRFGSALQVEEHKNILNALYYKGEEILDFEGKSGVNTMRLILNKELDLHLPYLELP
ncbi:MAG: hypothetical protein RR424_08230 [Oscillospiraceae bacterium]